MSTKGSGTIVRTLRGGGQSARGKGGTQLVVGPPRPSPQPTAPSPSGVSVSTTIRVGGSDSAPGEQRPVRAAPPTRSPNEPTRIYRIDAIPAAHGVPARALVEPPPAGSSAVAARPVATLAPETPAAGMGSEPSSRSGARALTVTFATPAFAPVAAIVQAQQLGPAVDMAQRAPARADRTSSDSAAASPDAGATSRASAAPRLRAFGDERARTPTWATAQTVTAPVAQPVADDARELEKHSGGAAHSAQLERRVPASPTPGSSPRRGRRLPAAAKKLSAALLAAATVIGSGMLFGRSMAEKRAARRTSERATVAAVPTPAPAAPDAPSPAPREPIEPREPASAPAVSGDSNSARPAARLHAGGETRAVPQRRAPAPDAAGDGLAGPAPAAARSPVRTADVGTPAPDGNVHPRVTLARQAVDALLAGDRDAALGYYRELSQHAPEEQAYREAVRLLTRAAADAPP